MNRTHKLKIRSYAKKIVFGQVTTTLTLKVEDEGKRINLDKPHKKYTEIKFTLVYNFLVKLGQAHHQCRAKG